MPEKVEYNTMDIEVPFLDPDWDYLELVHEFLLKLVFAMLFSELDNLPPYSRR